MTGNLAGGSGKLIQAVKGERLPGRITGRSASLGHGNIGGQVASTAADLLGSATFTHRLCTDRESLHSLDAGNDHPVDRSG